MSTEREHIVGMDRLISIISDSPEEAEAELARRINEGELDLEGDDCQTYEVMPEEFTDG